MFKILKSKSDIASDLFVNNVRENLSFNICNKKSRKAFSSLDDDFFNSSKIISVNSQDIHNDLQFNYKKFFKLAERLLLDVGVKKESMAKFIISHVSKNYPTAIFPFLKSGNLVDCISKIPTGEICRGTMAYGNYRSLITDAIFKINVPQFRSGNGGHWFLKADEASYVVNKLIDDSKRHNYHHRLSLIDHRNLSTSDGFTDRSGIKASLDINLKGLVDFESAFLDCLYHNDRINNDFLELTKIILRVIILDFKSEVMSISDLNSLLNMPYIESTFERLSEESHETALGKLVLNYFKYFDYYENNNESILDFINYTIRDCINQIRTITDKMDSLISSHSNKIVSYRDAIDNNEVIITILPEDNDISDLSIALLRKSISTLLGTPIDPVSFKNVIEHSPPKINGYMPCVFGHPSFYRAKGMGTFSAQMRALKFGVFKYEMDLMLYKESEPDEYRSNTLNIGNHLFLPSRNSYYSNYSEMMSDCKETFLRAIGDTKGSFISIPNKTNASMNTKYNEIAFMFGSNYAIQIKI
jgi:hypothetical protein